MLLRCFDVGQVGMKMRWYRWSESECGCGTSWLDQYMEGGTNELGHLESCDTGTYLMRDILDRMYTS